MDRIDISEIADALISAPGWARLGLTEARPHLREDAATELARAVFDRIVTGRVDGSEQRAQIALDV